MLTLIRRMFIVLLSFSESLPLDRKKCLFLKLSMARPTLISMNPVELKYYPFMISLQKRTGRCNDLSPKICVPKETKDINVKAFNIITKT